MTKNSEKAAGDSSGFGSLFGAGLFSSSSLFGGSSLLSPTPPTPATDSASTKAFESKIKDTLGGSSLSTTASTSPFSSSLFGPGGLFGNTSSVLATPSEPPPKSEAEKKNLMNG